MTQALTIGYAVRAVYAARTMGFIAIRNNEPRGGACSIPRGEQPERARDRDRSVHVLPRLDGTRVKAAGSFRGAGPSYRGR